MKKTWASLLMLGITACAVFAMLSLAASREVPPVKVETCRVEMGCVEQVIAASGVLRYEMEYAAVSPAAGVVEQVYVQQGDRVVSGQPLFRLAGEAQAAAITSVLTGRQALPAGVPDGLASAQLTEAAAQLDCLTVRAAADGVVQKVNVVQHGGVMAGTPAVALSGEKQEIQCSMVLRDAEELQPGMRARIMRGDEPLAGAVVKSVGPAQVSEMNGQTVCQVCLSPEASLRLPLGAQVDVEIILRGQDNVPVLPLQAVSDTGTVWWVSDSRSYEIDAPVLMSDDVNCWVNLPRDTEVVCGGDTPVQGGRVKEMSR